MQSLASLDIVQFVTSLDIVHSYKYKLQVPQQPGVLKWILYSSHQSGYYTVSHQSEVIRFLVILNIVQFLTSLDIVQFFTDLDILQFPTRLDL